MLFYFFLSLPLNFVTTKMMKAVMLNKMVMKVKMITNKKKDKHKNKNHKLLIPMLIMPQMLSAMEWLLEQDSSKLLLLLASHIKLMELLALVMINSLPQA